MLNFIPLEYYTPIFHNFILILVFAIILKLQTQNYLIYRPKKKDYASSFLLITVILYMGLRPVSGRYFGDMGGYNYYFNTYAVGGEILTSKDYYWHIFMKFCSGIMTAKLFFVLCAFLYIFPLYKACKNWFENNYSYLPFLMLIASYSFWPYGTNGIRNGIATSFFVFALSYDGKKYFKYAIFSISFLTHGSMFIPIAAYLLTEVYKNSKHYLIGWFIAIGLSLALGDFWETFFNSFGVGKVRGNYLTSTEFDDKFRYIGFRWDFVLYSASAVFAGYYFIIKKKFEDELYQQLFNIYLAVNAFWILIIRASFSNRFAYLSWFMMGVIIFYPLLKKSFFIDQQKRLALIVFLYFSFTYFMTIILGR